MADIPLDTTPPRAELQATDGGQGSFSYADTSVYGNRQNRQQWGNRTWALVGGIWVPTSAGVANGPLVVPGSGGGAKLPGRRWFGGRATGFSPNGAVVIRLFKVT